MCSNIKGTNVSSKYYKYLNYRFVVGVFESTEHNEHFDERYYN